MASINFWDMTLTFHESASSGYDSGEDALKAVLYLESLLRDDWDETQTLDHPLRSKLVQASEPNYLWLMHFAQKLQKLSTTKGSEGVIKKLAIAAEYNGALAELDFALKLHLGGIRVEFIEASPETQTPDLMAEFDGHLAGLEITSMNLPDEAKRASDAFGYVHSKLFYNKVTGGGVICDLRTPNHVRELEHVVEGAVDEALRKNKMVKRNYPGLVTLYVAPRDLAHEIPEHSRGKFRTWSRSSLHKKEQIIRKIQTKGKSNQLQKKEPGLLVIYDRFLPAEESIQFFEDPADDVGAVLATYPVLSALILIAPPYIFESVTERAMSKEHRVYIEHSLPDREGERIIVWKNKHGDFPFPEALLNALENYPRNLSRLFGSSIIGDGADAEDAV
ncbi:MAG: hypothetical protein KAR39_06755 [Thermoplasmata archaeon]|nr:hypothetical protein [Thermoplasmata archaeon]